MCFYSKQTADVVKLENRFRARFVNTDQYKPTVEWNGFSFPKTPVITNIQREEIRLFQWGLLPSWAKGTDFQKSTLNARIETINEKSAFRDYTQNRCLVLLNGFYEWQWLDDKGKNKQKYLIGMPDEEPFAVAGLWSNWCDKQTGENIGTYTILTTIANEQMSEIHNSKKRMPFVLTRDEEELWIKGSDLKPEREIQFVINKL